MDSMIDSPLTGSVEAQFSGLSAAQLLRLSHEKFGDRLAMSTSFGIQSAVTLHLATRIIPDIKVIWVDTGYLPDETYAYATVLAQRLDINLHMYESSMSPGEMERQHGRLWESDQVEQLNLYDQIRKVEPMNRALDELGVQAWVSGLRAQQTEFRKKLSQIKQTGNRLRLYPILDWTNRDVYYYMKEHDLPQHPLFHKGYTTVGDVHSSRPMSTDDQTERDTRFRGVKQECGLHF